MKKIFLVFSILFSFITCYSQSGCDQAFISDTLYFPPANKILNGESVQTGLKNMSTIKLFKTSDHHYYLKFFVTRNFYFDKVSSLEIRSGSKSYYAKDTKQYKVNKSMGMFVIEIFRNYVSTLKEEGITAIVFAEATTDFTRQDASQVKSISKCFYESITAKK